MLFGRSSGKIRINIKVFSLIYNLYVVYHSYLAHLGCFGILDLESFCEFFLLGMT